jgi:hypothetical protein
MHDSKQEYAIQYELTPNRQLHQCVLQLRAVTKSTVKIPEWGHIHLFDISLMQQQKFQPDVCIICSTSPLAFNTAYTYIYKLDSLMYVSQIRI